jgi:siroheme synthase (precorrin-2 oxidase/ferrochelatase)
MYGEKAYSYSAQEVAEYREAQKTKREHEAQRKAMLNTIMAYYEAMDSEALAKVVATL